MYQVIIETHFSAAHKLRGYPGECAELHGHNFKVRVTVQTRELNPLGFGIDFKKLKDLTEEAIQDLDHKNLNELPSFRDLNPTAENIAKLIYDRLRDRIKKPHRLHSVQVWESDKYSVVYKEDEGQ